MTLKQVTLLNPGTTIYRIFNGKIESFWYVGLHPKYITSVLMGSVNNIQKIKTFEIESHMTTDWETSYEVAKEIMWKQLLNNLNSVNQTYFEGKKSY